MLVLSKIRPLKCWDFVSKRRFPVSFPRFTVVFPDFQRNNTQGGDCPQSDSVLSRLWSLVRRLRGQVHELRGRIRGLEAELAEVRERLQRIVKAIKNRTVE